MNSFNQVLAELFRCDEELCSFAIGGELNAKPGYFQFGEDVITYGRCSTGSSDSPSGDLIDVLRDTSSRDGILVLPFDPNEAVSNLRLERYFQQSSSTINDFVYRAYYAVRPLLPVQLRRHLQKVRLNASRRAKFPQWPLDCSADRILDTLLALSLKAKGKDSAPFVSFWPGGVSSCAIMTHDVETEEGLRFCDTLMDIDDSFGIKSSFQLVPEERYQVTDKMLASFVDRGFEVNVHDFNHDGHLYSNQEQFQYRAKKINEYSRKFGSQGFRSGAMYRNVDWYGAFDFKYDMSMPTVGHLEAQGGGCCTLRPYFISNLVELPLTTTQDYSLFHILGQYSTDLWKQQIDAIIERRGLISFIVHPDYILDRKAQRVYKDLLAYLAQMQQEGKLSICLPRDVANWWTQRSKTSVEYRNDAWQVSGPAESNACVSYARVDEAGNLAYV